MSVKSKILKLTALCGLTIGVIHIINKIITMNAVAERVLDSNGENYYDWKFGKIFYTKKGTGKPLLLVHDLDVASSSYEWNKTIDDLSQSHTVYAIELLGCGRSEKTELDYTNYLYVQLITDFINTVIKERTDVITTGESSSFIVAACKNNNQIIDRVIMVNPKEISELEKAPRKTSKTLMHLIQLPVIGTFLYNIITSKNMIEEQLTENNFYDGKNVSEKDILTYYKSAHLDKCKGKYLLASLKGNYTSISISYLLKDLGNSVYIIKGNCDDSLSKVATEYKDILPSIEIVGIDKCKYLPQLEQSEKFVEEIKILLND